MDMDKRPEIRYINSVVCGSCAYVLEEKEAPKKRVKMPKPQRKSQNRTVIALDRTSLVGIAVASVLLVLLVVGFVRLQDARAEAATLSEYVNTLQIQSEQLKETYASGYDLEEIERIALAMGKVPASQVPHISMQVNVPTPEVQPTGWESFLAFLTGLFA
jgi:hypothetical protein